MKVGDLVRYRTVISHLHPEVLSNPKLGVLVERDFNLARVLTKEGKVVTLWARLVEKAGNKDKELE